MAYWPIPMAIAALLLLCGLRWGGWLAPLVVLCGYIGMRLIVTYFPAELIEVSGCALWLKCAAVLCYKKAWVPGLLYALSGVTYPALLVLGFKIEYMGLSPIISASFGLLALIGMGGGIYRLANPNSSRDYGFGVLGNVPNYTLGMASHSLRS